MIFSPCCLVKFVHKHNIMPVQTLTVENKKFAIIPLKEYQELIEMLEDLQDLADVKKRKNEPRVPLEEVKKQYKKKAGNQK